MQSFTANSSSWLNGWRQTHTSTKRRSHPPGPELLSTTTWRSAGGTHSTLLYWMLILPVSMGASCATKVKKISEIEQQSWEEAAKTESDLWMICTGTVDGLGFVRIFSDYAEDKNFLAYREIYDMLLWAVQGGESGLTFDYVCWCECKCALKYAKHASHIFPVLWYLKRGSIIYRAAYWLQTVVDDRVTHCLLAWRVKWECIPFRRWGPAGQGDLLHIRGIRLWFGLWLRLGWGPNCSVPGTGRYLRTLSQSTAWKSQQQDSISNGENWCYLCTSSHLHSLKNIDQQEAFKIKSMERNCQRCKTSKDIDLSSVDRR